MKKVKLLFILLASTIILQAQNPTYQISAMVLTNNYQNFVPNYPVIVIDSASGAFGGVAIYNYVTDSSGQFTDSLTVQGPAGVLLFMAPDSCGFTTIAISYSPNSPSTLSTAGLVLCNNIIGGGPASCNYTVSALPVAGMPNQAFFTFSGQGGSTYLWDFGDGNTSNQPAPFHTYAQAGTYYYCLQIDSCTPVCDSITVFNSGGCDPFFFPVVNANTVDIYPALLTGQFVAVVDWGDGVVDTFTPQNIPVIPNTISHTYNAPGNYQICFTHSNAQLGCSNTQCNNVTITTASPLLCNASFIIDTVNSQPGMVYVWNMSGVTGASPNATVDFLWNFGDGSTSNQPFPTHQYQNPGTYALCLTVTAVDSTPAGGTSCSSTYCDTLTVDQNGNIVYKGAIMGWTLTVLNPATIGQEELSLEDVLIYPNPAKDEITIEIPALALNEANFSLTDISGAVVKAERISSGNKSRIDISGIPSGIYIITLQAGGEFTQAKLVKY